MIFEKRVFFLTGATQFLATAMLIEIIHCPEVFDGEKKVMLTVDIFFRTGPRYHYDLCAAAGDSRQYYCHKKARSIYISIC